jgi:hypothetical protein
MLATEKRLSLCTSILWHANRFQDTPERTHEYAVETVLNSLCKPLLDG